MTIKSKTILNRTTRASERYTLINDGRGMGGAGQDSAHYSRNWCVAWGADRGYGYQGYMSIDAALESEFVPDDAKRTIRETLGL